MGAGACLMSHGPPRLAAMKRMLSLLLFAGALWPALGPVSRADTDPPSVLFIMIDDLRDWTGYTEAFSGVETPHLQRLAEKGTVFSSAHCAAPVCAPSRTALLTGLHPGRTGVYTNSERWPESIREAVTLTRHFMDAGYTVAGYGKIYHGQGSLDYWHEYEYGAYSPAPENPEYPMALGNRLYIPDAETGDGMRVNKAIAYLERHEGGPLFLACGLVRPHTPWDAPAPYFDRYPLDRIALPRVVGDDLADIPPIGRAMAGRPHVDRYHGNDNTWTYESMVDAGLLKINLQAYLASITFADAQIGRLLEAWEASPHAEDGIVVMVGDHGWHHGEKLHWSKRTLWEVGTRTPLIIHAPGLSHAGDRSPAPVSLLDLFPTLVDLCGLPGVPGLDGVSLRPLLQNPTARWNRPAMTLYGRDNVALKTERWRYIRYADGGEELYDHRADPDEIHNLAGQEGVVEVLREFRSQLPDCRPPAPLKPRRKSWFVEQGLPY